MEPRHSTLARAVAPATCALLVACAGDLDVDDDVGAVDLQGTVIDRVLDDAPVSDAWIIVDTGAELITTRSGGDGSFSVPALPADDPITITVAAEDRRALTVQGMVLSDTDLPLEVDCGYRSPDDYDRARHTLTGRASGLASQTGVLISGSGMLDYEYLYTEAGEAMSYEFEVEDPGTEEFVMAGLAYDGYSGALVDGVVASVPFGPDMEADLVFEGISARPLTVTSPQVTLDGTVLERLDDTYVSSLCLVYLDDSWGAFLGWNDTWALEDGAFVYQASYIPIEGRELRVSLYQAADLVDPDAFSYASARLNAGDTALEIAALDSPHLDTHGRFEPGTTVSWDPVMGADEITVVLLDGDEVPWTLVTRDAGTSIDFPRLPDDMDPEILLDGDAEWMVRAWAYDVDDEDEFDPQGPYLVSETRGGAAGF